MAMASIVAACNELIHMTIEPLEPTGLFRLPAEIRVDIYRRIFGYPDPIELYVNKDGYINFTEAAKLGLQILRTCRSFYLEASSVLYGSNMFVVAFDDTEALSTLRQLSLIPIKTLTVKGIRNVRLHKCISTMFGSRRLPQRALQFRQTKKVALEVLDLGTIGTALPCVQHLIVEPSNASSLLVTVLDLTGNLPCSPLRDWPTLEVIIDIPATTGWNCSQLENLELLDPFKGKIAKRRRLSAMNQESTLGTGHEMPHYKTLQIRGQLSLALSKLIELHRSSFGDCYFEKEVLKKSQAEDGAGAKIKYTWSKEDPEAFRARILSLPPPDMQRWVPKLHPDLGEEAAGHGGQHGAN